MKYLQILLLILATLTTTAHAGLIEYTFSGDYKDGSTASGTFLYDDSTMVFSNANIELSGGTKFTDSIFDYVHYVSQNFMVLLDSTDGPLYNNDNIFHIILQGSDLFGELNPTSVYSDIGSCDKNHCPARDHVYIATSTSLVGRVVVPEPKSIFLMGLALIGIAHSRRKAKA